MSETNLPDYIIERRKVSQDKKSFRFKHEYKPGLIQYFTIDLGKKYKVVSDTKRISGSVFEVLSFVYRSTDNIETAVPLGVQIKFLKNNQYGTYYDLHELVEVE
jgi:hypothetical protein